MILLVYDFVGAFPPSLELGGIQELGTASVAPSFVFLENLALEILTAVLVRACSLSSEIIKRSYILGFYSFNLGRFECLGVLIRLPGGNKKPTI